MHVAIIVPYRPQSDHTVLTWTLEGYANQKISLGHTIEVHVGLDGPAQKGTLPPLASSQIMIHEYPQCGAAAVRNALVREVSDKTDLLVFGNADARPDPDMVQQHASRMATLPSGSLILGAAPWERTNPTVLDTLIDHTPMIFSYCHAEAHHWYPFRIAYSLNLSVRRIDFIACGGFHDEIRPYFYEDLAFGCRILGPQRAGLFYEPAARVLHRHPMTLEQYLDREELLGIMAPVVGRVCPEAFAVLMEGRKPVQIVHDFKQKLATDKGVYNRIYRKLRERMALPSEALGSGEARTGAINMLFQLHIPVKLLAFRLGFIKGMELADDIHWKDRHPTGLWRGILEHPDLVKNDIV